MGQRVENMLSCWLLLLLQILVSCGNEESFRETVLFQLPNSDDELGRICANYSKRYCLHQLVTNWAWLGAERRVPQKTNMFETIQFLQLISHNSFWKQHNWFDLETKGNTGYH